MPKPDFTLKFTKDAKELQRLSALLVTLPAFALDIETTEWWNWHRERVALIQIAFRADEERIKIFIIDAPADFDPETLRLLLEKSPPLKSSITPDSMRRLPNQPPLPKWGAFEDFLHWLEAQKDFVYLTVTDAMFQFK
jgi:hypothetical protein